MTMAGYNPDVALSFWQKMSASSTTTVPEFMSTHPSDATRISAIQKELPGIKSKYMTKAVTTTTSTNSTKARKVTSTTKKSTTKRTTTRR